MLHFPISQTRHLFPVAVPSGINAFLYSDLRTFRSVSSPWYLMIPPYSIPRTPWNKKTSNIEGVLKRKYFKRGVQQSNSPTRERILKCNSLLYSSIYFLFNHIYILQWRCLVGRCWTLLDVLDCRFSTIQLAPSNKNGKKCGLLDVLDVLQQYFLYSKFV